MEFNPLSKVWIYQSNRAFTAEELSFLHQKLVVFTDSWTAHNQQLKAGYEIRYNRFIILIVDETQAGVSGCSIDKSIHLMKEIEQELNINLFDRFQIAWKDGDEIKAEAKNSFEKLISEGFINNDTIVFNNLINSFDMLNTSWEVPLKDSWHARVFAI